jgi:aldehyde dehydrogenase (NAD+)
VVIKPSELNLNTSSVLAKIIRKVFNSEHVCVVEGDVEVNKELLKRKWDLIFFTGSPRVGKIVMEAASRHLTPVVLELGGKNPVIVSDDCNISISAKRIVWGKFLNAGQSCVAPDYLLIHEKIRDGFLLEVKKYLEVFYTTNPEKCNDFSRIVNSASVHRLKSLMDSGTVYYGGDVDEKDNYMSPTVLIDVKPDSPIMQEEIFGPILPVITFSDLDEALDFINSREKPLAAYFYSSNKKDQKKFLHQTSSGDAEINDSVMHFVNHKLPFGGIGNSGMGSGYHGRYSFDVFSHKRSVLKTTTFFDLPLRYPPYRKFVLRIIKFLFS